MLTLEPKIKQSIEVDIVTSNGSDINSIIQEICDECHEGLETSSLCRQNFDIDNCSKEDIINDFCELIERLEGKFCNILDLLED